MIDLITYIPNVEEFRAEAQANAENEILGFSIDDDDNLSYNVGKIPVFYHADGKRTLSWKCNRIYAPRNTRPVCIIETKMKSSLCVYVNM